MKLDLRLCRELVLIAPGDSPPFRDVLGRDSHVVRVERVSQAVAQHRVHYLLGVETLPKSMVNRL